MLKRLLLLLPALLAVFTLTAQDVGVLVKSITETREADANESVMELVLSVSGIETNKDHQLRIDGELAGKFDDGTAVKWKADYYVPDYQQHPDLTVRLKVPTRQATTITNFSGTLFYVIPTAENGGIISVGGLTRKIGTDLLAGKGTNLKAILVNDEFLADERTKTAKADSVRMGEEIMARLGENPTEEQVTAAKQVIALTTGLKAGFQSIGAAFSGSGNKVMIKLEGDSKKFIGFCVKDATGKIVGRQTSQFGDLYTARLDTPLEADWTLEFAVETKASVRRINFIIPEIFLY